MFIDITNGINTIKVTEGAYREIFKAQGYIPVSEKGSSVSQVTSDDLVISLPDQVIKKTLEDNSDEKTDDSGISTESSEVFERDLSEIPLSEMTNQQLSEYARQLGIDLTGLKKRTAVINKIKSAL